MRAFVTLRAPDGQVYEVSHGGVLGRLWSAALPLDDARVSEAHAMVSLRGEELKLLSLRGLFSTGRRPVRELTLETGQRISLARGVVVEVLDVELPDRVLALEAEGLPAQVLAGVCSLITGAPPALVSGYHEGAAARIWSMGSEWRIRIGDSDAQVLAAGSRWEIDGFEVRVVEVPLATATQRDTLFRAGMQPAIRLVTRFDTVHVHREGMPVTSISGIPARIVSELAAVQAPVSWEAVANGIWGDLERLTLRRRWDVNLRRLRVKLRDARLRPDLVRADGSGNFELVLYPADQLVVDD
jgi:hypothetical protein